MTDVDVAMGEMAAVTKVETVFTSEAPKGRGPFPQAVRCGDLLFVSGQGPLDPTRNEPDIGSFEHEAQLTITNLAKIAKAAGCELSDAVNLTVYLADISNVPTFNDVYRHYFSEPFPARTLVEVGLRGIQVEISGMFACRSRLPEADGRPGGVAPS